MDWLKQEVEDAAAEVKRWPAWMRGADATENPKRKSKTARLVTTKHKHQDAYDVQTESGRTIAINLSARNALMIADLYDLAYWIVNGDPRRSNAERLEGIRRRAAGILRKVGN